MISVDRTKSVVMARLTIAASSTGVSSAGWSGPRTRSRIFSPPSKHR